MAARIIVIDNNEAIREFLTLSLSDQRWQVLGYAYAQIDLATVAQLYPNLIILDFDVRDGGTSWEFLQLLKMDDATASIPILITTTAVHFSAELQGYLFTRYIHVVTKPFDLNTFFPLVQKTLTQASQAGVTFSSDRILPILVVDDVEDMRQTITTVLRLEGYKVATAANGLLALDAVYKAEHCLILLDIVMPVMDGFEFLSAYEQQLRPHSPVIILSGERNILARVLPSFVIDVIPKPFEVSHLLKAVEKYAQPV